MTDREFKGVWIPVEVWLDEDLSALDKVILAEIDSLDDVDNHCYATNEYLAKFCNCSVRSASASISLLLSKGYISIVSFDGRRRVLQSRLADFARQPGKIGKADMQNLHAINIDNKYNNKKENTLFTESTKESRFQKPTFEEVEQYWKEKKLKGSPREFWLYYDSNGWKVGKNPMKNWHSAASGWSLRENDKFTQKNYGKVTNPYYNPDEQSDLQF